MGIVYRQATITPSKDALAARWVPTQPWAVGRTVVGKVAEYRFDDPEGEVGVETIVWRLDDDTLVQVPFTYRAAPLEGADGHLVGTSDHTVLGPRWIYDGCGDPVWAQTLATAVLTGGTQAQMFFEQDGERIDVPPRLPVRGSGSAADAVPLRDVDAVDHDATTTTTRVGGLTIVLARVLGATPTGAAVLRGRLGEQDVVLAAVT